MIQLSDEPPRIRLADHREGERPILVYRVRSLQHALKVLVARG
jgi:hypothetical protein